MCLLIFLVLTGLVGNATRGLTSRLARSLALAAATVFDRVPQVTGFERLNLHCFSLLTSSVGAIVPALFITVKVCPRQVLVL